MPAKENENMDTEAITTYKTNLGIKIEENELDRSYRLGSADGPIIVKFTRHNIKNLIYTNKKKLKGKNIVIMESLT